MKKLLITERVMVIFAVILLLIAISNTVRADHHRGHAIDRGEQAIGFLTGAQNQEAKFDKHCDELKSEWTYERGTSLGFKWENVVKNYTSVTQDQAQNAISLMSEPVVDLDVVRRIINQPIGDPPLSALNRIEVVTGVANGIHLTVGVDIIDRIKAASLAGDNDEVERLSELGEKCLYYLRGVKLKTTKSLEHA